MRVTHASTTAEGVGRFTCRRCGFAGEADVIGVGQGVETMLNSRGTAERRASDDARDDVARTVARARCPSCKQRNPGVVAGFWLPYVIGLATAFALGIVVGYYPTWSDMNMREEDRAVLRWLCPLIFGGTAAIFIPLQMIARWANPDGRVRWRGAPAPAAATAPSRPPR
jgi:hypothetical protein